LELGIEEELVKSESQTKINYELKCEPESFIVIEMIPAPDDEATGAVKPMDTKEANP